MPPDLHWQDAPGGEGEFALTNDLTAVVTRDHNAPLPSLEWRVKILRHRGMGMQVLRDGHSATLPGARMLAEQMLIEVRLEARSASAVLERVRDVRGQIADLTASVLATRLETTP